MEKVKKCFGRKKKKKGPKKEEETPPQPAPYIKVEKSIPKKIPTIARSLMSEAEDMMSLEMDLDTPIEKRGYIRFVCISDTHSKHQKIRLPRGDVLLHAGIILNFNQKISRRFFKNRFNSRSEKIQ